MVPRVLRMTVPVALPSLAIAACSSTGIYPIEHCPEAVPYCFYPPEGGEAGAAADATGDPDANGQSEEAGAGDGGGDVSDGATTDADVATDGDAPAEGPKDEAAE